MNAYVYAVLGVAGIILLVRFFSLVKAKREMDRTMPAARQLSWFRMNSQAGLVHSWKIPTESGVSLQHARTDSTTSFGINPEFQPMPSRPFQDSLELPVYGAAAVDGMIAGLPLVHAIASIDPSVLAAIQSSTADHIDAFPGVHSYVQDHFFNAVSTSADGWFERLTGYVAEQKAAAALEAAGHHVVFATTANQPIWDLMVDGHPVQIKEGLTGVKDFLAEHHGVTVYTGHEVAAAAKDPMVHGLSGLGSDHIHDITSNSLHGIHESLSPSFHFPLVTLGFAVFREFKLLRAEKTTFERASKNVGLDVAGVGAGTFAGAKTGAFAGSILGPFGTAVGGFLGAIVGGVGGKLFATSIRHADFDRAREEYLITFELAQVRVRDATDKSRADVRVLGDRYSEQFAIRRSHIADSLARDISALEDKGNSSFVEFAERFPVYLSRLLADLREDEANVLESIPGHGFSGWLVPRREDRIRAAIKLWFIRARRNVKLEQKLFVDIKVKDASTLRAYIVRFFDSYDFELAILNDELFILCETHADLRARAADISDCSVRELEETRADFISRFSIGVEEIHASLVRLIDEWNGRMRSRREDMQHEAAAVGIDL